MDDTTISTTRSYSSDKVESVVAALIDDVTAADTTVYSSNKTDTLVSTSVAALIGDENVTFTSTYSSNKIDVNIVGLIDDTTAADTTVYSSNKVDAVVDGVSVTYTTMEIKRTGNDTELVFSDVVFVEANVIVFANGKKARKGGSLYTLANDGTDTTLTVVDETFFINNEWVEVEILTVTRT